MTVIATEGQFARYSSLVKMSDTPEKFEFHTDVMTANETGTPTYTLGTVLGTYLASPTGTAGANVGTGNGVMGAITVTPATGLEVGIYTVKITKAASNAGDFVVVSPGGRVVGNGTVGVAFSQGGIAFTLADGATDFVVGDSVPITVAGTSKVAVSKATATDGSQVPSAIYLGNSFGATQDTTLVSATDTKVLALTRGKVIVAKEALKLDASFASAAQIASAIAALVAKGILPEASY